MKKMKILEKKRRNPTSTGKRQMESAPRLKTFRLPKFYALRRLCNYDPVTPTINDSISVLLNERDTLLAIAKEAREHLARSRTTRLSASPEARHAFVERMEAAISRAEASSVPSAPDNHLAAPVIQ